ncbi:hypothetical protein PH210_21195 [Paenibacillus sp. BSR1-1]|uniref:hypothetical protein n=1 Tax=Paenibacillus sp. BSR1-1 TaxID=3020845 RepID=UPI0025B014CE|nr:hypothetical protein [Paenibacillus sp. BSR1-1]MDN3018707.1 hypothetical protein [Paenibacillus sp. BSR1-1]
MLKVRVKLKEKKVTIPVPYPILNLLLRLITSKRITSLVNKAIENDGKKFTIPQIDRKDVKPLFKALIEQRGLTLVETKFKDGTEVTVQL